MDIQEYIKDLEAKSKAEKVILKRHIKSIVEIFGSGEYLSISQGVQYLVASAYSRKLISQWDAPTVLFHYKNALMKIYSEVEKAKTLLKIEVEKFGPVDTLFFKKDVLDTNFRAARSLGEWESSMQQLKLYVIASKNLEKFTRKLELSPVSVVANDKVTAREAQSFLVQILDSIEPSLRTKLKFETSIGKKGIKFYVKNQMTKADYSKYFNNSESLFKTRWRAVNKKYSY